MRPFDECGQAFVPQKTDAAAQSNLRRRRINAEKLLGQASGIMQLIQEAC